jgi:hypothetical protein
VWVIRALVLVESRNIEFRSESVSKAGACGYCAAEKTTDGQSSSRHPHRTGCLSISVRRRSDSGVWIELELGSKYRCRRSEFELGQRGLGERRGGQRRRERRAGQRGKCERRPKRERWNVERSRGQRREWRQFEFR